ncbi:hypothetical protein GCM10009838_29610 [Catenulispora subtropica]|uniref:Uncharacterized protein n=1 Tax=Catenulispora subtropica TaxID=450798 RepID=A0ABN2RH16_9ACTN
MNRVFTQSVVDAFTNVASVLPDRDAKSAGVQDWAATAAFVPPATAPVLALAEALFPSIWCGARSPTGFADLATAERSEPAVSDDPTGERELDP